MLSGSPLGCFQRVGLRGVFLGFGFDVRCHIAGSETPFCSRVGESYAVYSGRERYSFLAPLTFVYDGFAGATIVLAAFFCHESTLISFFNRIANHWNHILSFQSNVFETKN
jgi:hypothetical protein